MGNLGAAHAAVALCDVLERARPGQVIVVLSLADGADAFVLRTTDALAEAQRARAEAGVPSVAEQVAGGRDDLPYATFLTWRGQMHREPPRRPDPERPGAPTVHRSEEWKYAFAASRCLVCGFRHMPPTRACLSCHAIDQMQAERLADVPGTVATFTIDHLAFSLSPPVVGVIVDFDGGGRYRCEMTDVVASELSIGDRVAMTFRRVWTAQGVHNYFWKARPAGGRRRERGDEDDGEQRHPRPGGHHRHGLHPLRRAVGQGRRRPADRRRHRGGGVGRHVDPRHRRLLARHHDVGRLRRDAVAAAQARLQAGDPGGELLRHRLGGLPQRLLRGGLGRLRHRPWPSGWRSSRTPGTPG